MMDAAQVPPRHRAREAVVKALYQWDVARSDPVEFIHYLAREDGLTSTQEKVAIELLQGVFASMPEIDRRITAQAHGWRLSRLAIMDRNVLRLACYELCTEGKTPVAVCIDEAVDLANVYGTEDSARFVNGVLGELARSLDPRA